MRNIITGLAATIALIAAPALAETKPATATPAASSSSDQVAKDQRYCVESKMTGSRIAKKTCKTRADWIADDGFDPLNPDK